MTQAGIVIVDGSNVGHAAAAGKVLRVGDVETHAVHGFLRTLRAVCMRFPNHAPIIAWDGESWRKKVLDGYKGSRDKSEKATLTVHDETMLRVREAFKAQRPLIMRGLMHLGVTQMQAFNLEADDLAGLLVKRYAGTGRSIILLSGDKDWLTLVQRGVIWINPVAMRGALQSVHAGNFEKQLGVKDGRAWLDVKALMGDSSDEIPGVGGIGEKGAKELVNRWGSVIDFFNASLTERDLPKKYQALADDVAKQNLYHRNIALMDLTHPGIPAPVNMRINKGTHCQDGFGAFCRELLLQSALSDLPGWMQPFKRETT